MNTSVAEGSIPSCFRTEVTVKMHPPDKLPSTTSHGFTL